MVDKSPNDTPTIRRAPQSVDVPFIEQWSIVLPVVFRYEDKQWIDQFFTTGKLRLSTFARFATYADEVRGDTMEGRGVSFGFSKDQTVAIAHAQGFDAFVLCGSTRLHRDLKEKFGRDSVFAIENTLQFTREVARQLPGSKRGMEGQCIYRSTPIIQRDIQFDLEKYKRPDGTLDMAMLQDVNTELGGAERLLLKRKQYEDQNEYRFLWAVDAANGQYIDIHCPRGHPVLQADRPV